MKGRWPEFEIKHVWDGCITWVGQLRGFQRPYQVGVIWNMGTKQAPYVYLIDPPLVPRAGATYEDIPHLMFDGENPASSGLCLYDPEGNEWSDHMLIADTTLPWAARWLYYYELWHYDGKWRGGGVGPESVARARAEALHREAQEHPPDATGKTSVASE
jgi:hypothetical protein